MIVIWRLRHHLKRHVKLVDVHACTEWVTLCQPQLYICLWLVSVAIVDLETELSGDGAIMILWLAQLDHLVAAKALRAVGIGLKTCRKLLHGLQQLLLLKQLVLLDIGLDLPSHCFLCLVSIMCLLKLLNLTRLLFNLYLKIDCLLLIRIPLMGLVGRDLHCLGRYLIRWLLHAASQVGGWGLCRGLWPLLDELGMRLLRLNCHLFAWFVH